MRRVVAFGGLILTGLLLIASTGLVFVDQRKVNTTKLVTDTSSLDLRAFWMRQAIRALNDSLSPCPFQAFGAVIVNHTASNRLGDAICTGVNGISQSGNPTLHGEIAAINNCSDILTDPNGAYKLLPSEALAAYKDLTLYTTAEPCPMCASAIRWAGFKECVFGTSVPTLVKQGWPQIRLRTQDVFAQSFALRSRTELFEGVSHNETDALFAWQFNPDQACPAGCVRDHHSTTCLEKSDVLYPSGDL